MPIFAKSKLLREPLIRTLRTIGGHRLATAALKAC